MESLFFGDKKKKTLLVLLWLDYWIIFYLPDNGSKLKNKNRVIVDGSGGSFGTCSD